MALEHAMTSYRGSTGIVLLFLLTFALDGGGWLTPRPGRFVLGKETQYPFCRRSDGARGRSGRLRKLLPTPEFDPRIVQAVARRYTDYAVLADQLIQSAK